MFTLCSAKDQPIYYPHALHMCAAVFGASSSAPQYHTTIHIPRLKACGKPTTRGKEEKKKHSQRRRRSQSLCG